MAQMAAGALGIPFEKVTVVTSDSARMGNPGSASALRGMKRASTYSAARGAQLAYVQAVGVELRRATSSASQ
jgi:CO/xanthine dehydrogenase Mo-binding subunit